MTAKQKYMTKSEIAAQYIQEQILSGEAPAGTQITTKAVSTATGMSETPVREAIKSLAAEGWLKHTAHHGTVVATLNSAQIAEIFELRGLLNAQAVKRSPESFDAERLARIDDNISKSERAVEDQDFAAYSVLNREFHDLLCNTPEAEWTYRMFSILQGQSAVFRHGFRAIPDGLSKSLEAHLAIREALATGDLEAAARLVYEDEVTAGQRLIDTLKRDDGQGDA